ncbi:cytochrome P450 [Catenulispora rubra]|uniref:cytochrome P450 n=1 Tax=Catenulispora rubra TaxID=280293 RepID=UPI0018927219|nr:cytochrome P450 [Catenulispora rubra]
MNSPSQDTLPAHADPEAEQLFYSIMVSSGDDLYANYQRLRETAPALLTSDGTLVLSRFADCSDALRHRALGKGDEFMRLKFAPVSPEQLNAVLEHLQRSMIMINPPDHTRIRGHVNAGFTGGHVEALRASVTERAERLLEKLAAEPGGDFVSGFALALPSGVICDLLGVPEADRAALTPHILDLALLVQATPTEEQLGRGVAAAASLADYFTGLLKEKHANPADDMLSRLVATRDGDGLDDGEVLSTALLFFLAGNKTTADMLGNALHAIVTHPDKLAELRADPSVIPTAADELLRFDGPMQLNARTVLEPVTIAGADLEPGKAVIILQGAANHDPERFENPEEMDLRRTNNGHLAFSSGIHFCTGAQLAKLEIEVLLSTVFLGYSEVSFTETPERYPGVGMRYFEELRVSLKR